MSGLAFAVFGLPRSGTTWVANWLTTERSICWHDPIEWATPADIEAWAAKQSRVAGISCTGSWLHDWKLACPTIALWRDLDAVEASLARNALPALPGWAVRRFEALRAPRYTLYDLLDPVIGERVWRYLLPGVPFDEARHEQLRKMNVQPSAAELQRIRDAVRVRTQEA